MNFCNEKKIRKYDIIKRTINVPSAIGQVLRKIKAAIETSNEIETALMAAICFGERFLMSINIPKP